MVARTMKTTPLLSHQNYLILLCLLYSITTIQTVSCSPNRRRPHWVNHVPASVYISKSCKTTLYPKLCNKTLIKYADRIKSSPKALAMTALVATFNATQTTTKVLRRLRRSGAVKAGEIAAVNECVEVVSDAVYELQKSVKQMNQSRKGKGKGHNQFFLQMSDVQTWVSAALTDDDTCMDDFPTAGAGGPRIKVLVRGFVLTVARLTSIALTFINNYAAV